MFSCIALFGQNGCGFEAQLGSIALVLEQTAPGGFNQGFLRGNALLSIVILTNEDDGSVDPTSDLFNPNMTNPLTDQYGALQSYRCTQFGITCQGGAPPHLALVTPVTLMGLPVVRRWRPAANLRPPRARQADQAESELHLRRCEHGARLRQLDISSTTVSTATGSVAAPMLSRVPGWETYAADNPIRIASFVQAFGQHGLATNICQTDYAQALTQIGAALGSSGALCAGAGAVAVAGTGAAPALRPGCALLETLPGATAASALEIPACGPTNSGAAGPRYTLVDDATCSSGAEFVVSRATTTPAGAAQAVSCP